MCTSMLNQVAKSYSTNVGTSTSTTSTILFNHIKLADSKHELWSDLWCKEKKIEILKKGFPAIFKDMSKLKNKDSFAITKFKENPISFYSLENKRGVYMITNNVTKKFYIGVSTNLKRRLYDYLNVKRLELNKSSRLHKALLKYGFDKFSVSILELRGNENRSALKEREDFFIKVFKPQYNIKRSGFNLDVEKGGNRGFKLNLLIPLKIKNLLDMCLNPENLDWHLINFSFSKRRGFYNFIAITPKYFITANSSGWHEGDITNDNGYSLIKRAKDNEYFSYSTILLVYRLLDKEKLAYFYPNEKPDFVKNNLKLKLKALSKQEKAKEKEQDKAKGKGKGNSSLVR